jgi:hypothetical protein
MFWNVQSKTTPTPGYWRIHYYTRERIAGTDLAGSISFTTGSSPSASATVITVIYHISSPNASHYVLVTPANGATAALSGNAQVWVSATSTAHFIVSVGSTALAASTSYSWNYFVVMG